MSEKTTAISEPLPNSPLIEAVFELHWKLADAGPAEMVGSASVDPGFRILVGRFYDRVRAKFPVAVDLPISQVPDGVTPNIVRHQFRASREGYPVAQLGPGVFTYNHAAGYKWEHFQQGINALVPALFEAYPSEIHPFVPMSAQLMYINGIGMKPERKLTEFLRDFLHVGINIDAPQTHSADSAVHLNLAFALPITSPKGVINHIFADNKDAQGVQGIVWHIVVTSQNEDAPKDAPEITKWAGSAHEIAKSWFGTLARGKLLSNFSGDTK